MNDKKNLRSKFYNNGGRPRKAEADKAKRVVSVRFSQSDYDLIKAYAHGCKMPVSRYVRDLVLGKRPRTALSEQERIIINYWGEIRQHLQNMDNYHKHDPSWNMVRYENEELIKIIKSMLGLTGTGGKRKEVKS